MRDCYALYTDKLQGEYKDTFHQIEMYMDGKAYQMEAFEERMMELLDIFLSAQEKGKPVTAITGNNMERFCKNFCEEYSWQSRLRNVSDWFRNTAWWLLILSILELPFLGENWEGGGKSIFFTTTEVPFGAYLFGFLAAWMVSHIFGMTVRAIMFKVKWLSWKLYVTVNMGLHVVILAGLFLFCLHFKIATLSVPVIPMGMISGGYLAVYYLCNWKRIQEGKIHKVKFMDLVKENIAQDADFKGQMTIAMEKQLERKNKRRVRRGKEEWNWEEYISYLEYDEKVSKLIFKGYFVFPVLMAGFFTYLSWSEGESVTWLAIGGCFLWVLVVSYVIFGGLYSLFRLPFLARWEWIHEQRALLEKQKKEALSGK